MFRKDARKRYAVCGGLFGTAYLISRNLLPGIPDLLMGLALGLGLVFVLLDVLPEERLEGLRKWKWIRRG